ncbi:hypothetical protein ACU4GD_19875 [Cupriavidus basilensis]
MNPITPGKDNLQHCGFWLFFFFFFFCREPFEGAAWQIYDRTRPLFSYK